MTDNYFALGHPSDPNYFRPVGGSDFGIDYNPAGNVIDATQPHARNGSGGHIVGRLRAEHALPG